MALLACAICAWIQEIARLDRGNGRGRRTVARMRRELIMVPARLSRRGGTTYLAGNHPARTLTSRPGHDQPPKTRASTHYSRFWV
ncbi:hypothetical protein [Leekyejoonella antrihumi]|uniref:hypothetical protein n=1 Tax=Leekyejoonella antrihumi TaxID=1660198 RepID=UPI001C96A6AC|nr:hypothetical protein [Leekyejoonella antrihumi]